MVLVSGGFVAALAASAAEPLGHRAFADSRDPPAFTELTGSEKAQFDLGHAVFNTQWVPAGTAGAARRDGLGPLYNATACDACHNEGARGRGPAGTGPAPAALVVQLERSGGSGAPDPVYGHIINTAALDGVAPEALVTVRYQERPGHYPDGAAWSLRVPQYELSQFGYGLLAPDTVLKPRLAPALFGVGLLEAVPQWAIAPSPRGGSSASHSHGMPAWQQYRGTRTLGRFGWQGVSVSIRDQTAKAFSREMGLTSREIPTDDCTTAEQNCLAQPNGGSPEVGDDLFEAVVEFQRHLAVPEPIESPADARSMAHTFRALGCAACHRPRLPVVLKDGAGRQSSGVIEPYTDLLLHDMGAGLADVDMSGRTIATKWRTAPLWGVGYQPRAGSQPTLLHDGRARSIEEAILWHDGEALAARQNFDLLGPSKRQELIAWIARL